MKNINLLEIIENKSYRSISKYPKYLQVMILKIIAKVFKVKEIETIYQTIGSSQNFDFINNLFDYLDFTYYISSKDRLKIPSEGKLVCIANHPLGALDGLALLDALSSVRKDVKIVANDVLMNIDNLSELFLSYDVFSLKTQKENILAIEKCIQNEEAVIFFPAASVSRLTLKGIKDDRWQKGALKLAHKFKAPILPIFIKGRNSILFYLVSLFFKKISVFLLPREMLNKKSKFITMKVGQPIPYSSFQNQSININIQNKLLRKHLHNLGKNKPNLFQTEKSIIHPVDLKLIRNELNNYEPIGAPSFGKKLYLINGSEAINIIREISRLREITYRKVGEGTGQKSDHDDFDYYYKHLILWDERNLEIIGAYRLGFGNEIISKFGTDGFYNSLQFNYNNNFTNTLNESIELGRSFIQQKYWKSQALDYLWQGIGSIVMNNPSVRYLIGSVSISNNYSYIAKGLIIFFYDKWYKSNNNYANSKEVLIFSKSIIEEASQLLNSDLISEDYLSLKKALSNLGYSIPVLLRKYTELCSREGVMLLDVAVDKNFSDSIDCLLCLDLHYINPKFKDRYLQENDKYKFVHESN